MPLDSCRRFTVSDVLVLVAATALALAVMRTPYFWPDFGTETPTAYSDFLIRARFFTVFLLPAFASLSLAVLVLRLRRPRPSLCRLARQPGFVACAAATIVLGIRMVNLASVAGVCTLDLPGHSFWGWLLEEAMMDNIKLVPSDVGCAVAAAWIIQRIGGRWRPEPSWIDRAGRALGVLWISTTPLGWFDYMVSG